jgi:hypothetical protein
MFRSIIATLFFAFVMGLCAAVNLGLAQHQSHSPNSTNALSEGDAFAHELATAMERMIER